MARDEPGPGPGDAAGTDAPPSTARTARVSTFPDPPDEPDRLTPRQRKVLDVIRAMLTAVGHTVATAASGREALEIFDREPIDIVVTDLGMPGMTGLTLAEELKRRRPVPVVLLTGWADELDSTATPHVDVLLAKPITRERLVGALAQAVPGRVRSV